jgi:hypothetical protein
MALDYSKLSTEELEAIANDDYSRLSTETLQALADDPDAAKAPGAKKTPASLTPQGVDVGDAAMLATPALAAIAPAIPGAVSSAYQTGKALATPAASAALDLGKAYLTKPGALVTDVAMGAMGLPPPTAAEQSYKGVQGTYQTARDLLSKQGQFAPKAAPVAPGPFAAAAEFPTAEQIARNATYTEMAARDAAGAVAKPGVMSRVAQGAGSLLSGAGTLLNNATPAMSFAMPYQMAGAEMEKIRANPTAPEYATNPYAQMTRGEATTQGAAGAANRRQAIARQQYGGLTEAEQRILESDRLNMAIRLRAAKKVLGPVAP